jgi:hypothetical protein
VTAHSLFPGVAMSKTADDLIYEVASILGKAMAGESLGAVEYETIDGNIDPVLAEIENIAYVGDRNDIPDRLFQTIARLVAVHSAAKFANSPVDLSAVREHESRLQYLAAGGRSRRTLRVDAGVLQDQRRYSGFWHK